MLHRYSHTPSSGSFIYNNCTDTTYTHCSCPTWRLSVPVSWPCMTVMAVHDRAWPWKPARACTLMPRHFLYTRRPVLAKCAVVSKLCHLWYSFGEYLREQPSEVTFTPIEGRSAECDGACRWLEILKPAFRFPFILCATKSLHGIGFEPWSLSQTQTKGERDRVMYSLNGTIVAQMQGLSVCSCTREFALWGYFKDMIYWGSVTDFEVNGIDLLRVICGVPLHPELFLHEKRTNGIL